MANYKSRCSHSMFAVIAVLTLGLSNTLNAEQASDEFSYMFPVADFFGRETGEAKGTIKLNVEIVEGKEPSIKRCVVTFTSSSHPMWYSAVFLGFPYGSSEVLYPSETYLKKNEKWVKETGISEEEEKKKWKLLGTATGLVDSYVGHFIDSFGEVVGWMRSEYKEDMRMKLLAWSVPKDTRVYGMYNMPGASSRGWHNIRWVIPFEVEQEQELFVSASCFAYSCDEERLLQCSVPLRERFGFEENDHPYFPLPSGSQWTYIVGTRTHVPGIIQPTEEETQTRFEVLEKRNYKGRKCTVVKEGAETKYYYVNDGQVMLAGTEGFGRVEEFLHQQGMRFVFPSLYLDDDLSRGSHWIRQRVEGTSLQAQTVSRVVERDSQQVPAGSFSDLVKVESRFDVGAMGQVIMLEWFAEGVGKVMFAMEARVGGPETKTIPFHIELVGALSSYHIGDGRRIEEHREERRSEQETNRSGQPVTCSFVVEASTFGKSRWAYVKECLERERSYLRGGLCSTDLDQNGSLLGQIQEGPNLDLNYIFGSGQSPQVALQPGVWRIMFEGRQRYWVDVQDTRTGSNYRVFIDVDLIGMDDFSVEPEQGWQSFEVYFDRNIQFLGGSGVHLRARWPIHIRKM